MGWSEGLSDGLNGVDLQMDSPRMRSLSSSCLLASSTLASTSATSAALRAFSSSSLRLLLSSSTLSSCLASSRAFSCAAACEGAPRRLNVVVCWCGVVWCGVTVWWNGVW